MQFWESRKRQCEFGKSFYFFLICEENKHICNINVFSKVVCNGKKNNNIE